ncbi:hypothetical protein ACIKTA_05460 [Hansschlegelia beijingensis]
MDVLIPDEITGGGGSGERLPGQVETIRPREISGWVASPDGQPIMVSLFAGDVECVRTWAAAPTDRRRDTFSFRFNLRHLWRFVRSGDAIQVRANGRALPIRDSGDRYIVTRDGLKDLERLQRRLRQGYVFNQRGKIQLSISRDRKWQESTFGMYEFSRQLLKEKMGYDMIVFFGTLLGAIRSGEFIGHDHDFDVAYLSRHNTPEAVVEEVRRIAHDFLDAGCFVKPNARCLWIKHPDFPRAKMDLFFKWAPVDGEIQSPFGFAGERRVSRDDIEPARPGMLRGREVLIPSNPEAVLEALYGSTWRLPQPGFSWAKDRKRFDASSRLPQTMMEEIAERAIAQKSPI